MLKQIFKYIKSLTFIIIFFSFVFFTFFYKINAQNSFTTVSLDLNWQVLNSYTPLFYEGKPLISEESDIKVFANTKLTTPLGDLDSSKFFYDWYINGINSYQYSKTGGNTIYLKLDKTRTENEIKLMVFENNFQENLLATKIIKIKAAQVKPILYKKYSNPILTYANAINKKYEEYLVEKEENFEILAEPFYFSSKDGIENLSYNWSLNGIPGNINYSNTIDYNAPKKLYTNSGIGLKIEHNSKIYQTGETTVRFISK